MISLVRSVLCQARRLENTLDTKLGQFAKLCSGYEQSYSRGEGGLATDQVRFLQPG